MGSTCIMTRTFRGQRIDAFDLCLYCVDFGQGNSHLYLLQSITLPSRLLNSFYELFDESKIVEDGLYNYEYCSDLLETIASFIFEDRKSFEPFFYPIEYLDKTNTVQVDFLNNYNATKKAFRQKKYFVFNTAHQFEIKYIQNVLNLIKVLGKKYYLRKKTFTRKEFECYIENFETGEVYIEFYNELHSFLIVFTKHKKIPVCALALDEMKQIKLVIVTGNESITI